MKKSIPFLLCFCVFSFLNAQISSTQEQAEINHSNKLGAESIHNRTVPPTISTHPSDVIIEYGTIGQLTVASSNYDSVSWEFSDDQGGSWFTATDGPNFSGTTTTTLSIDDLTIFEQGYYFRAVLTNTFGSTTSNIANVYVFSDYTAIPDANFETALDALGYDNIAGDNQVPTFLIETVTSLDVRFKNISDLTGIEDFTALVTLECRFNSLATVNLTQNTNLEGLNIQYNDLTAIDLSTLSKLKTLRIFNNDLTALDLTNNPELEYLDTRGNNAVSVLNLTNNPKLDYAKIQQMSLTTLDLSSNTLLRTLIADANDITALDLTNATSLEFVDIHSNDLETLTFGNNTSISTLDARGNQLTTLDVSGLTGLTSIRVDNNQLTTFNAKNGYNTNISTFNATNNPNLTCILVDDADDSTLLWTDIDVHTSFSDTYCRYTAIPDANFESRLQALGYDDISGDGQVPTALIEGVTVLAIGSQSISDLTGIEDFVALQTLNAYGNPITSIDLSMNTALTVLDLDSTQITALDLSNNTLLTYADLEDSNITSLDISNNLLLETLDASSCSLTSFTLGANTNLTYINVNYNSLTSLDLSGLTSLEEIRVRYNDLTYLNVKNNNNPIVTTFHSDGNSNLTCILVDDADYSENNWRTSLVDTFTDFSDTYCRYTAIPDANFEARLGVLGYDDISGDAQVPTALIEGVTALDVRLKNISDLTGIEDFTALDELRAGNNQLTTLDLSNNLNLREVYLDANDLTSLNIANCTQLIELFVDGNDLSTLDVSTNTALALLDVSENDITAIDFTNNPSLEELDISNNLLESLNLKNNVALTDVYADGNNLSYFNIQNGANGLIGEFFLINNPSLTCILVDDATYSTTNWTAIDVHTSFSDTYCRYTAIPDANFEAALEALGYDDITADGQVPTALIEVVTNLDISNNASIADLTGIKDFTALQDLDVSFTNIGVLDLSGMVNLETLVAQSAVTSLDASNTPALTTILAYQSSLSQIDVTNATALEEMYLFTTLLTTIDVSTNTALERVEAYDSPLTTINTTGATSLAVLFVSNTNLTALDISSNLALNALYCSNTSITALDTSGLSALQELEAYSTLLDGGLDLTTNTNLEVVSIFNTGLDNLDLRNGNNTGITTFNATANPNLTCILVDDATYSTTNWTNIDVHTSFSDTYCRYTTIPDANFEARLDALGYDDISSDGQVPTALIEVVATLDLSSQNISNLTGIEDFSALTILVLFDNNLTTIDVSQNLSMEVLMLEDNNIASLDISNNVSLQFLNVNNNALSSVDISNNVDLRSIRANGNSLTALDVSANPNLTRITCENNGLTDIDLSVPTGLLFFEANGNQFTDLDLSHLTSLFGIEVANNNLRSLNVKNGNNGNIITFDARNNPNLTCILVDDVSTTTWTNIDMQTSFNDTSCNTDFSLVMTVYLQGAAINPRAGEEELMRDDLRVAGGIPTTSPYADSLTCDASVFNSAFDEAIVDWVWIELRDPVDNTIVSYSRSALLQRDGDIVDVDGVSALDFSTEYTAYHIAIKHRNHLGIMTNSAIDFSTGAAGIDFTDANNPITFGSSAQTTFGMQANTVGMWAADANGDGEVVFLNTGAESVDIKQTVLNVSAAESPFGASVFYKPQGYYDADVNMDGEVIFLNAGNELLFVKDNILAHPANQIFNSVFYKIREQMPSNLE